MAGERVETVHAWVMLDDMDGNEGIPAFLAPDGTMMPMIGADRERVEQLRPMAELVAKAAQHPIQLRRWAGPYEIIDTIGP